MAISQETAINYLNAGLCVLSAGKAQKRPLLASWSEFQNDLPDVEQVARWFASEPDALAVVCGKVSGNLEVIDFDRHGELFPKWKAAIPAELFAKLVVENTQSGGFHAVYRVEDEVCGNIKLASGIRDAKKVTLIETRGKAGSCFARRAMDTHFCRAIIRI